MDWGVRQVEGTYRHVHHGACTPFPVPEGNCRRCLSKPQLAGTGQVGSSCSGTSLWAGHAASLAAPRAAQTGQLASWSVPGIWAGGTETVLALVVGAELKSSTQAALRQEGQEDEGDKP